MYTWRLMTPEQRAEALTRRRATGVPWHSPPHRNYDQHLTYILTSTCYDHAPILACREGRLTEAEEGVLEVCGDICDEIYAWCFLPNHYHLLLQTDRIRDLRRWLGKWHGISSRRWNIEDDRAGRKVWNNCFERPMKSNAHFYATLNYIHNNPVRHALVMHWQDWPYSSARLYLEMIGRKEAERIWKDFPVRDYGKKWDW